jgi:hypothetical protein
LPFPLKKKKAGKKAKIVINVYYFVFKGQSRACSRTIKIWTPSNRIIKLYYIALYDEAPSISRWR